MRIENSQISTKTDRDFSIVAKNLCKRFSDKPLSVVCNGLLGRSSKDPTDFLAIDDVSFEVRKGESVGILGVNGSGKSTLLQLVSNILKPSSGQVQTYGKLAALLELGSGFNLDFTGRENIYLNASILGLTKTKTNEILDAILDFADIGEFIDRPIYTYSSGMRMRLAFAVQVFVKPDILLVDEALGVGDQFFKMKCLEKINQLLVEGITFLCVSHNEETLRRLTNRIIVLDHGKIIMDGDVQESIDAYNMILGQNRRFSITNLINHSSKSSLKSLGVDQSSESDAQITKLRIFDGDNNECDHFTTGDIIKIGLNFSSNVKYDLLSFGLRIRNKEGAKIYSWSTSNLSGKLLTQNNFNDASCNGKEFNYVEFEFECNLGSNLYQIESFVSKEVDSCFEEKEILDWVSMTGHFAVTVDKQKNFFGGICDLQMKAKLGYDFPDSSVKKNSKYGTTYDFYWSLPDRFGSESFKDIKTAISDFLKLEPKSKILDLGCGMSSFINELCKLGFECHGIDTSSKAIEYCRKNFAGNYDVGCALNLPYHDGEFDTLVSFDCLEHISEDDLQDVVQEIYRVTKRQAFLRIATRLDRDKKWHLTVKPRKWWETFLLNHGFRLHPLTQQISSFESLENEVKEVTICVEKIPLDAAMNFSKEWLAVRRTLHADMLRESNRRSDAHIARYHLARKFCPDQGFVLDAASGLGYGSHILGFGRPKLKVFGVDSEKEAIEYSKANFLPNNENLSFKVGKVENLRAEFSCGSLDMICSFETLEHIDNPNAFIQTVYHLLKPTGIFICSVPNMWVDETGKDPNPHHLHVYDYDKLLNLVSGILQPIELYAQIAGNGNKFPDRPRTLKNIKLEAEFRNVEAEWCLLKAQKSP